MALTLLFLVFQACNNDDSEYAFVHVATPKYMTLDALRLPVEITAPEPIIESGKIYVYDDLILVSDKNIGIHLIDNSNPESPAKVACIKVKANNDMEIKGDYLYVDSLMDLVVFDISDLDNINEVTRLEDVFPAYVVMPFFEDMIVDFKNKTANTHEIIVGWEVIYGKLKK